MESPYNSQKQTCVCVCKQQYTVNDKSTNKITKN